MTGPYHVEGDELATVIRGRLWDDEELLSDPDQLYPLSHPLAGHCFVASEAYMVLSERDLKPMWVTVTVPEPGPTGDETTFSHWFLRDRDTGEVVDLTAEQFTEYEYADVEVPYDEAQGKGFGTRGDYGNRTAKVVEPIAESERNDWEAH